MQVLFFFISQVRPWGATGQKWTLSMNCLIGMGRRWDYRYIFQYATRPSCGDALKATSEMHEQFLVFDRSCQSDLWCLPWQCLLAQRELPCLKVKMQTCRRHILCWHKYWWDWEAHLFCLVRSNRLGPRVSCPVTQIHIILIIAGKYSWVTPLRSISSCLAASRSGDCALILSISLKTADFLKLKQKHTWFENSKQP